MAAPEVSAGCTRRSGRRVVGRTRNGALWTPMGEVPPAAGPGGDFVSRDDSSGALDGRGLFDPVDLGSVRAPNRLAVTAMVTRLSGEDGYVNDAVVERYRRFSEGGAGLVVVEASAVHGTRSGPLLRISEDRFIEGHSRLVESCHRAGGAKVFLQIIHFLKVARSGWRQKVGDLPIGELEALPGLFAAAALRAREAGYDGVELHMAHAYTLSSMLSRRNRRRDHLGRSLENRMRLPSAVLSEVRQAVGDDFGVGVRFDADESIRRGYSVDDAGEFAIRFAELGASYVSLSAGGKFEDAVHREGKPLYPYTGYSGDRCMPGDSYPDAPNIWMARAVRASLRSRGLTTPVIGSGKIGTAELAGELIARGDCDLVGMARALLADPYLPHKSRRGESDRVVRCIYCNVCKSLDENFKTVVCYLWPAGSVHAPAPGEVVPGAAPGWPPGSEPLTVTVEPGQCRLRWQPPGDAPDLPLRYEVERAEGDGPFARLTSCTRTSQLDDSIVGGRRYGYRVRACGPDGTPGLPSNTVVVEPPGAGTGSSPQA